MLNIFDIIENVCFITLRARSTHRDDNSEASPIKSEETPNKKYHFLI